MYKKVQTLIEDYDSIIIARHKNPDLDAYGSQFGLFHALKGAYRQKDIYITGDTNRLNFFGDLDEIDIETRKKSLVIILDTVAKQMLRQIDYMHYHRMILIDHHRNDPDINHDIYIKDIHASSTAEMVSEMLFSLGIDINLESAKALYMGIVGDTGRFMFDSTTSKTFQIVSKLLEKGIHLNELYKLMYLDTFENKKIKSEFFRSVKMTKYNVAYRKNTKAFLDAYGLESNYVSRGLIGQMAGIKEIPIWVNFTYDRKEDNIKCEIRSRDYPVLDIAKKYGGGGHLTACGCSLNTWEETDKVLEDLDHLIKEATQ
ncbi:MAG TPA: bifunctional oligoribonuclease/PAP phosphatase NrnA [Candidatus Izemoplasmatales bacterium]|nr:bifunctional oligoribonuclease/PAP phosphatase NrnA [Candidatus Izemoplasmatales bacterium]